MLSKIFTIIGTIREVVSLGRRILDMYEKWQDRKIDAHYESKTKRRERLLAQIKEETDDGKLIILHRKLRNLDSDRV